MSGTREPSAAYGIRVEQELDRLEARARQISGAIHKVGAIPARCWRQAIAERFFHELIRDPEWAETVIARWDPPTLEDFHGDG